MHRSQAVVFTTLALTPLLAHAAVTTYSQVSINSATSVSDSDPDSLSSTSPGSLELSAASTTARGFASGGRFAVKPVTDDVFAKTDLATAVLQTNAILGMGANTSSSANPLLSGTTNASASATATFADSFSTRSASTGSPFLWSDGDNASFHFAITGTYDVPSNVTPPNASNNPRNLVLGSLRFQALNPGGLELLNQLNTFDFANRPFSEYQELNTQYEAHRIPGGFGFWYLGDPVASFPAGSTPVLAVSQNTPTGVDFSFNPHGDFEWFLSLDNTVQLDGTLQDTTVTLDFSHTIQTTYLAPIGATTLSSSGVFPNTSPLPADITGDTNDDGVVDLIDLNNVLNNFGSNTPGNAGDDNGDNTVDLQDLNNVLNNFGAHTAASSLATVPEPASLAACGLAVTAFAARRRSR